MPLSLIVAMARNGVIGRAGGLPWKLSADLKRFKSLTMGHHLLMGSHTFFSLGKILPGRISIVLTNRAPPYSFDSYDQHGNPSVLYDEVVAAREADKPPPSSFVPVALVQTLSEALRLAAGDDELFVIGGGKTYQFALHLVTRMYVTWVEREVEGDTYFPAIDWTHWREINSERHSADEKNEYDTTFCVYDRIHPENP